MGRRSEFDPANKILLMRFEGQLTDESAAEFYGAVRKYSTATDARAESKALTTQVSQYSVVRGGQQRDRPAIPSA